MAKTKLQVSLGIPTLISNSPGYHWYPDSLLKLEDGSMLLGFSVHPDGPPEELMPPGPAYEMKCVLLRSLDDGTNWFFHKYIRLMHQAYPNIQLDDGTILSLGGYIRAKAPGELFFFDWRSHDNGKNFEGPIETPITFPDLLQERSLIGGRTAGRLCRTPVTLENGDLLCLVESSFKGDNSHSRIMLIKSIDKGASWSYHATVAQNLKEEGFCEPTMAYLSNGEILCMMRTGSGSPMFQCCSSDYGQSWSKPHSSEAIGVFPCLLSMSNGVVACSYGRVEPRREEYYPPEVPAKHRYYSSGDMVMFSVDGGRTWTNHTTIWYGPSTGYTTIIETKPGELLYAYDVLETILWDHRKNSIQTIPVNIA